jgi:hypothetical protein
LGAAVEVISWQLEDLSDAVRSELGVREVAVPGLGLDDLSEAVDSQRGPKVVGREEGALLGSAVLRVERVVRDDKLKVQGVGGAVAVQVRP